MSSAKAARRRDAFLREQAAQMRQRRFFAGTAFVVLMVLSLVGTDPFQKMVMSLRDTEGDAARQVLVLMIFAMLMFSQTTVAAARPPMAVPLSLTLLLGYCMLTALWAVDPMISLRRLALTALVVWILVRSIGDLGAVRTLTLLRWTLAVLMVANFFAVWFTSHGVHGAALSDSESLIGDWRGVLPHKNIAGATCAFTVIFFLFDRKRVPPLVSAAVILPTLYFLIKTNSKTSMAVLVLAIVAGWLMYFYNPRHRSLVWPFGLLAIAAVAGLVMMYSGVIEQTLNDPAAISGRAAIWPLLLEYAGKHLWTGAGFGSFWQIGPTSPIFVLTDNWVAKYASHGHNGFLDLLVTIGLPGLIFAVVVMFFWPALLMMFSFGISRQRRALFTATMVFCASHNMTESSLLDRASIVEVFLVIVVVLIHRLSDQSVGRHHELRARLREMFGERQLARLRRRIRRRRRQGRLPAPAARRAAAPDSARTPAGSGP